MYVWPSQGHEAVNEVCESKNRAKNSPLHHNLSKKNELSWIYSNTHARMRMLTDVMEKKRKRKKHFDYLECCFCYFVRKKWNYCLSSLMRTIAWTAQQFLTRRYVSRMKKATFEYEKPLQLILKSTVATMALPYFGLSKIIIQFLFAREKLTCFCFIWTVQLTL